VDGIDDFLQFHRLKLLTYLDGIAPDSPDDPSPQTYIDQVLNEWSRFSEGRELDSPSQWERTFWFALYQLEELIENPVNGDLDPFEGALMQNLAIVRELLRRRCALPDGFHATRPGEDLDTF